jgi:hypothetical protein
VYWIYSINWESLSIEVIEIVYSRKQAMQLSKSLRVENAETPGGGDLRGLDRAHAMKTFGYCIPTPEMIRKYRDRIEGRVISPEALDIAVRDAGLDRDEPPMDPTEKLRADMKAALRARAKEERRQKNEERKTQKAAVIAERKKSRDPVERLRRKIAELNNGY